jgi:hypothetical protein
VGIKGSGQDKNIFMKSFFYFMKEKLMNKRMLKNSFLKCMVFEKNENGGERMIDDQSIKSKISKKCFSFM